jgi:hypothetical protein
MNNAVQVNSSSCFHMAYLFQQYCRSQGWKRLKLGQKYGQSHHTKPTVTQHELLQHPFISRPPNYHRDSIRARFELNKSHVRRIVSQEADHLQSSLEMDRLRI